MRLTIRALMIAIAATAIWLYIFRQSALYQARHVISNSGDWGSTK
jgi:hypothetical protein